MKEASHLESWEKVESGPVKEMRFWLQSLTKAESKDHKAQSEVHPKVLFLLDNDYGELTTILYLLLGQDCLNYSKVLLSPRLFEKNKDVLPGRIEMWSNEDEVIKIIDTFQPEILVFAAGYLLPVHDLLTCEAIGRICTYASSRQAKIMTADPFLGLVSQWSKEGLEHIISIDIPTDSNEMLRNVKRIADNKLHTELAGANGLLRDYPHLYPTYTDSEGIQPFESDALNKSFFNENLLIPTTFGAVHSEHTPHWVFIISEVDFQIQSMFLGAPQFASIVLNLLTQGAKLKRNVIFLGPTPLIDLLRSMMISRNKYIHLFNFGAFERVMALLLTAEYSFYWNVVSHSILIQLWNGRPVVLFDKGHLVRSIPTMYDRVISWYYQGWEPPYIDQNEPLTLEGLAQWKNEYEGLRERLMERYQRAPSPEMLLKSFMDSSNEG